MFRQIVPALGFSGCAELDMAITGPVRAISMYAGMAIVEY
jgi:hypothetical protein